MKRGENNPQRRKGRKWGGGELNSIWISSSLWSSWITVISWSSPDACGDGQRNKEMEKWHSLSLPPPPPRARPPVAMCGPTHATTQGPELLIVYNRVHLWMKTENFFFLCFMDHRCGARASVCAYRQRLALRLVRGKRGEVSEQYGRTGSDGH